jgi:Kef-type K+ transport system membrane component KefB
LLKEEFGTMVMTATIVDDLINWTLFAIILNNISPSGESAASMPASIAMVLVFFVAVLGIGRWLGPRGLHWMRGHLSWPTGFIALTALLILFASSAAEQLGIHAFLGAFLVGAALGGHDKEHVEAHRVISHFALGFFAPIYFVSMGLNANFVTNFDWALVLLMIAVAYLTKTAGVLLGARLAGMPVNREVLAISMGLNARGATGIILAGVGLTAGVIDERIFVAVVVMALVTSITSGPAIKYLIGSQIQRAAVVRAIPSEQSPGVQV